MGLRNLFYDFEFYNEMSRNLNLKKFTFIREEVYEHYKSIDFTFHYDDEKDYSISFRLIMNFRNEINIFAKIHLDIYNTIDNYIDTVFLSIEQILKNHPTFRLHFATKRYKINFLKQVDFVTVPYKINR